MEPVETLEYKGKTINIFPDQDAESPRDWDNASVLVCFHRRYNLGDKDHGYREGDYNGWAGLEATIRRDHDPVVLLPLGLIDHSGISMYVGGGEHPCDPGGWDSGTVGFVFVSRATAIKEWGNKNVTKRVREMAEKCARGEVEVYDQFLRGDVYAYVVEDAAGDTVDSCCGFFGADTAIEAAKEAVG